MASVSVQDGDGIGDTSHLRAPRLERLRAQLLAEGDAQVQLARGAQLLGGPARQVPRGERHGSRGDARRRPEAVLDRPPLQQCCKMESGFVPK